MYRANKIMIAILAVILIGGAGVLSRKKTNVYLEDYYSVVNYAENTSYEMICSENGDIISRAINDGFEFVHFDDGRIFVFRIPKSQVRTLARIEVLSDKYTFGKGKLGVGSDKDLIMKCYENNKKWYHRDNWLKIIDGSYEISYHFDSNETATKITMGYAD